MRHHGVGEKINIAYTKKDRCRNIPGNPGRFMALTFHDGLILFQFDTIAPNLVPSVSNDLVQLSEWEQMKKGTKIRNRFV